ncbi:hypothetical protein GNI_122330 [Gregarina niphandrodes]|uniref:Uncharacterized protein n=1 Tax=Gregarina niphandrodes TaxID=110365 RepID=A0A023B2H9_GRENI|nr:hypothetical protein GNI_122330 [Gregarina niphandrodes]EZG52969.1 hypothetical protein GNI_122330 [Gregarina niphandrodes]|eukprot:XP_011131879.1 hypothetical protein GNI_122330 [Gregarina niphandrodes]
MVVEIAVANSAIVSPQEDENFEYSYSQKGSGFLAIKGDAEGRPFALTIQTLGFLLGRDNVEADDIPFVGCHAKAIHKSHRWIITILRPAGTHAP